MIILIDKWLEYSYLCLFKNKTIIYGDEEESILLEEKENIFILNGTISQINFYENHEYITIIVNEKEKIQDKKYTYIFLENLCEDIGNFFKFKVNKNIINFCKKNLICPFLTIYKLKLEGELEILKKKENSFDNTISVSRYLQSNLWYFFLEKKSSILFKDFSLEKCFFLYTQILKLEKDFGFISSKLSSIFFLPINYFY